MNLTELVEKGIVKKGNIDGVFYREVQPHTDDRGFFIEVAKEGELFIPVKQTSLSLSHPGVIKAFHWHKEQTDLWFGFSGRARAVLYDLREASPTFNQSETFYLGQPNYPVLLIPPHVAHGYQVLGNTDFVLIYNTDKKYDPQNPDEQRIPFDKFGKDIWEIAKK